MVFIVPIVFGIGLFKVTTEQFNMCESRFELLVFVSRIGFYINFVAFVPIGMAECGRGMGSFYNLSRSVQMGTSFWPGVTNFNPLDITSIRRVYRFFFFLVIRYTTAVAFF